MTERVGLLGEVSPRGEVLAFGEPGALARMPAKEREISLGDFWFAPAVGVEEVSAARGDFSLGDLPSRGDLCTEMVEVEDEGES